MKHSGGTILPIKRKTSELSSPLGVQHHFKETLTFLPSFPFFTSSLLLMLLKPFYAHILLYNLLFFFSPATFFFFFFLLQKLSLSPSFLSFPFMAIFLPSTFCLKLFSSFFILCFHLQSNLWNNRALIFFLGVEKHHKSGSWRSCSRILRY